MRDQLMRARSFGRRALFLTASKLFLMSTLAMRLYYLQINQSEKYTTLADDNRIKLHPILPKRGKLFDRYGQVIAENQNDYKIWFDPAQTKEPEEILKKTAALLGLDDEKYNFILGKFKEKPKEKLLIADHANWDNVTAIEVNNTELPGVSVNSAQIRNYLLGKNSVHLIGYVSAPLQEELKNSLLLDQDDFKVGRSGVEKAFEEDLRGKIGIKHIEVNAYGLNVRELNIESSSPGKDVKLSIDADLQRFAAEKISAVGGVKECGGAVIVMDIKTGEITALASSPGFDPNTFVQGVSHDDWAELMNHPDKPLINKAISTQYSPGSTFKVFVSLAALEKGVINQNTKAYCPGYMDYGDRRFHCWNERGHGQMNVREAISQSCNVFFYKLAQSLGIEAISSMAKSFGFNSKTGIELTGEAKGIVPSPEWKRLTLGKDWYIGETINTSIGQGYMLVTPIQLVKAIAQVANGGIEVTPTLLKVEEAQVPGAPVVKKEAKKIKVSQENLILVKQGMDKGVNRPGGTAYGNRITDKRYAMAGKTGTVQVRHRLEDQKAIVPRKFKNHAIFIGYAPVEEPRFALSVVIEHGGSGSFAAAPVAKEVLHEAQRLYDYKNGIV